MTELFNRLGIGNVDEILILNEPDGFCGELDKLKGITIRESVVRTSEIDFAIIFVTDAYQIESRIETVYPKLIGDAVIWFAYPNDPSKTTITEKDGWAILGDYNLQKTEVNTINNDWTGIRFRKTEFLNQKPNSQSNNVVTH